jgi:hypothetical protein
MDVYTQLTQTFCGPINVGCLRQTKNPIATRHAAQDQRAVTY